MTVVEFLFRSLQFSVVATALLAITLIFPVIKGFARNRRVPQSEALMVEMELVSFISFVGLLIAVSLLAFAPRLADGQVTYLTLNPITPAASVLALLLFYFIMVGASVRARRLRNTLARNPEVRSVRIDQVDDRKWFWVKVAVIFFTGMLLTSIELSVA